MSELRICKIHCISKSKITCHCNQNKWKCWWICPISTQLLLTLSTSIGPSRPLFSPAASSIISSEAFIRQPLAPPPSLSRWSYVPASWYAALSVCPMRALSNEKALSKSLMSCSTAHLSGIFPLPPVVELPSFVLSSSSSSPPPPEEWPPYPASA